MTIEEIEDLLGLSIAPPALKAHASPQVPDSATSSYEDDEVAVIANLFDAVWRTECPDLVSGCAGLVLYQIRQGVIASNKMSPEITPDALIHSLRSHYDGKIDLMG